MSGTSVLGGTVLLVIGIGFLGAALATWLRHADGDRSTSALSIGIDVLVGTVSLTDAVLSVIDEPGRVVLWWCGSAVLVIALGLLLTHHRRAVRRRRRGVPSRGASTSNRDREPVP